MGDLQAKCMLLCFGRHDPHGRDTAANAVYKRQACNSKQRKHRSSLHLLLDVLAHALEAIAVPVVDAVKPTPNISFQEGVDLVSFLGVQLGWY